MDRRSSIVHTDLATARAILAGDEAVFRSMFDTYFPRLYRFALARTAGNEDAAREVVQQTFCKAIEKLDTYRGEASLYAWFCQVCRNTLIDSARRAGRQGVHVTLLEEAGEIRAILDTLSGPSADEPDNVAGRVEILRLIQATMDALPERYGDVLEWKYIDGLSVNEIAAKLGIGSKAAESTLTRARAAFRQAVEDIVGARDAFGTLLHTTVSERS